MIKFVRHDLIDKNKWDNAINSSVNAYIYANSDFLDATTDNNWDALIKSDYEVLMPLPYSKKFGIRYVHQPFFNQQLGIFWKNIPTESEVIEFINSIPKDIKFISINFNKWLCGKVSSGFVAATNTNYELEINRSYDYIYEGYSTNLKRNLKKATSNKLIEINYVKPEELIYLFRENRGKEIKAFKNKEYKRLLKLIYLLIHQGKAEITGIIDEHNSIVAAGLFVKANGRIIFLFSGLSPAGKELRAMPYLIDSQIKKYQNSNLILDFEGSNNKNLARFYKSFGAKKFHYERIEINRFSFPLKLLKNIYSALKSKFFLL